MSKHQTSDINRHQIADGRHFIRIRHLPHISQSSYAIQQLLRIKQETTQQTAGTTHHTRDHTSHSGHHASHKRPHTTQETTHHTTGTTHHTKDHTSRKRPHTTHKRPHIKQRAPHTTQQTSDIALARDFWPRTIFQRGPFGTLANPFIRA